MPLDKIKLGSTYIAAYKELGAGPGGEDLHFETDSVQPDNAVGRILWPEKLQPVPTVLTEVFPTTIAGGVLIFNNSLEDQFVKVTVKTKAGTPAYLLGGPTAGHPLEPGPFRLELDGITLEDGLEWIADQPGAYGAFMGWHAQ